MTVDDDGFEELATIFLEEGREHVEQLSISLIAIEQDASDEASVREAFRAAHSLKGMAASMGHARIVQVTHVLEDVLDVLRTPGSPSASAGLVTAMLVASDRLAVLVEDIAEAGAERADVTDLDRMLQDARSAWLSGEHSVEEAVPEGPDDELIEQVRASGNELWKVTVVVSERSLLPGARAWAALEALGSVADLVTSHPSVEDLELGVVEAREVVAWLAAGAAIDADALVAAGQTREVVEVIVDRVTDDGGDSVATGVPSAVVPIAQFQSPGSGTADHESPAPLAVPVESEVEHAGIRRARTVRVDSHRLDELMHSVEELLVRRSRLQTLAQRIGQRDLIDAIDALDRAARELQGLVMDVRMVSIDMVLRMVPRMARDLAQQLGKDVKVEISGRDTELDRTVVDVLADPLVHLVRNAIDHGIEGPDERVAAGKPRAGTLSIVASSEAGAIWIRVSDDGRGLNADRVRQRAVERGLVPASDAASMSDADVLELCFAPGFSTRTEVNDISGRGVGLDVVRASVRSLGGDVLVSSGGGGTTMTIRLPLTLAIRSVLLVRVGTEIYAIHTDRVGQTLDLEMLELQDVAGRPQIVHLGTPIALAWLEQVLDGRLASGTRSDAGHVVIIEGPSSEPLGIVVDEVVGQVEVVTRALPATVEASGLLSATAVLGGGEVAFLIDADTLAAAAIGEGAQHVSA